MNKTGLGAQSILIIGDNEIDKYIKDLDIESGDQEILEGEELKIADFRNILRWLSLRPFSQGIKLVVIKNADLINSEVANALLKTLEEPPVYAKLILTTLNEQKVLPTIQSRCQKMRVLTEINNINNELFLHPAEIAQMTVKDKFAWVNKVSELKHQEINQILVSWQVIFRQDLLNNIDRIDILSKIAQSKDLLLTNISVKLLLENLVLNFHV